jgi:uncharacterized PurR-regulated membrane protein YhhQ (DUF165 family)
MHTLTAALYVAAIVAANVLTAHLGAVPIGLGLSVTAGTFAAGIALTARNLTQDAAGRRVVLVLMLAGVVISYWMAGPALALASGAAFALSELADMAVYTPLRDRGRTRAQLVACTVGAVLDSLVFLWLAGFGITFGLVAGQVLVKLASGAVVLALVGGVRRAVFRQPQHA